MARYAEYFDVNAKQLAYTDPQENLADWLGWLDMLLADLFDTNGGLRERDYYRKRGTVATHEDIAALLERPDHRAASVPSATASQEASAAFYHIIARQELTLAEARIPLPLPVTANLFELSPFEFLCLLLALAPEYDRRYERIFGYLQDTLQARHASLGLARDLFALHGLLGDTELYSMHGHGLKLCFVRNEPAPLNLLATPLVLSRRVLGYIFLQDELSPAVDTLARVVTAQDAAPMLIHNELLTNLQQLLLADDGSLKPSLGTVVQLWGGRGTGKKLLANHLAATADRGLLVIDMGLLCALREQEFRQALAALAVEGTLCGKLVLLDRMDGEETALLRLYQEAVDYFVRRMELVLLTSTERLIKADLSKHDIIAVQLPYPSITQQNLLWESYSQGYSLDPELVLAEYASKYRLSPGTIHKILREANTSRIFAGREQIIKCDLVDAISAMDLRRFESLTSKVPLFYNWGDIELQAEQQKIMQLACSRLKLRYAVDEEWGFERKISYGKGICVLFYGPHGTGKTMAAQVMAQDIGMDLYRVDLSQLSSKYIGETEKNISKIFDEARRSNIILFFDEADSIFSKRTEVKSSNDKHSNNEVSFLLQKIEEHDGLVILSTNLFTNFDVAFMRRVTYIVRFEQPNAEIRHRLWTGILPAEADVDPSIDLRFFAEQFELTGSNIKSILHSAAFIAAGERRSITNADIILALKYEYSKLGKFLCAADLGRYAAYLH